MSPLHGAYKLGNFSQETVQKREDELSLTNGY